MGFASLGFASCDGSRVFRAGVVQWVLGVLRSGRILKKQLRAVVNLLLLVNLL